MFAPKTEYDVKSEKIVLKDFFDYKDKFILRPPYQRKANIWSPQKRSNFLDSLCKSYYIPKIVLRTVRFSDDEIKWEVIDGQQRITTIIYFYQNKIKLPASLKSIDKNNLLVGRTYSELEVKQREWFDKTLYLDADIITNIEVRTNPVHLKKAADIFWRLQQGEPLTFMETLHARLDSSVRNFVARFADDISFDFKNYELVEENKERHKFFRKIIAMKNDRMQHLELLTRLLMIEFEDGATELKKEKIAEFIEKYLIQNNKIEDDDFENKQEVKKCLRILNKFSEIFEDDPMIDEKSGVQELKVEYFMMSLYMLLRHLDEYYVFGTAQYPIFKNFVTSFYARWKKKDIEDQDIIYFRDNRQQSKDNLEIRDMIIRSIFFKENTSLILKDARRSFNEYERIMIYRRDKGICKKCIDEGKNDKEATVSWSEYNADHIIAHIKGGKTEIPQGQVLCKYHNIQKRDKDV